MEQLLNKLRDIEGVKTVRKKSKILKIKLFSRPVPNAEAEEISGDLRKIGQNINSKLEEAREDSVIQAWNWIQKPEKKYAETRIRTEKVKDRKPVGHEPAYYTVSVQE